jgi:hypothetical protein
VVQEAIEHGADRRGVSQQLAPILHRAIGSNQRTGTLVVAQDNFQEFFGRSQGQLAHALVIDDEQGDGRGQAFQVLFTAPVECGVGEFIEQSVGFAIEDARAVLEIRKSLRSLCASERGPGCESNSNTRLHPGNAAAAGPRRPAPTPTRASRNTSERRREP